LKYTY